MKHLHHKVTVLTRFWTRSAKLASLLQLLFQLEKLFTSFQMHLLLRISGFEGKRLLSNKMAAEELSWLCGILNPGSSLFDQGISTSFLII